MPKLPHWSHYLANLFAQKTRRLRERLRASRDMLATLQQDRVGEHLSVVLPDQGINLTAQSTGTWTNDTVVSSAALNRGVIVMPLSRMNVASSDTSRLLLGLSGLSEREADLGTRLLTDVFKGLSPGIMQAGRSIRQTGDWPVAWGHR